MKSLLIICGAGHATSTVVRTKFETWLKKEELTDKVKLIQSSVGAEISNINNEKYDIVVSTTQVPASIKDKVISGTALLTGFGAEQVFKAVKDAIEK